MNPTRILIADDHELIRRGLRAVLECEEGVEVCGEAATGREAVTEAARLVPDVVVLDLSMPELNGFEATHHIRSAVPQAQVLILTMHDSEQMMQEALRAGARGYVLKADAGQDLVAAVNAVRCGRPYFTSRLSEMLLGTFLAGTMDGTEESESIPVLTSREREVLQLLAEGKSNKEISSILGISVKTAETHRTNLMRKLDLHSVTDLVRYAIRNNIIQP